MNCRQWRNTEGRKLENVRIQTVHKLQTTHNDINSDGSENRNHLGTNEMKLRVQDSNSNKEERQRH
jgi:hypothetical protein